MSSIPKEDLDLIVREIVDTLDNPYTDEGQPFWLLQGLAANHPAVQRATIAIEAAQRTAVALVARDLEGLIGREIEKRRGEAAVSMLAATLALVGIPQRHVKVTDGAALNVSKPEYRTEYKTEWRVGDHPDGIGVYLYAEAVGANLACRAPEPVGPRFPFPGKREGDVFLLHDADNPEQPFDVYASADGLIVLVDHRYAFRWSVGDVKEARSAAPRHDTWHKWIAALDAHLARSAK